MHETIFDIDLLVLARALKAAAAQGMTLDEFFVFLVERFNQP